MSASLDRLRSTPAASASGGQPLAGNSNSNIRQTHNHLGSMGLHKSSHTAGAREVGLMGAMASCAPPNTLLIAAPTPRPCPAPTPLSTAATQTELTMVDLSKLASELVERKVEDEYRRFKQRVYARKSRGKKKVDECMRIWNEIKIEEEWDQKLKVEIRRLKQRGYERKYKAKLKAMNQMVENKKPRTESSQPLARETAASHRTGIRSIITQMD